jgi:hypothetical protein
MSKSPFSLAANKFTTGYTQALSTALEEVSKLLGALHHRHSGF